MKNSVGIIGAGVAGIAAAIRLAIKGYQVAVYESNSYPGGKLSQLYLGNYRFDAGPSLFTMPHFVDELYTLAGKEPKNHFTYQKLDVTANYFFEDGATVTGFSDPKLLAGELYDKLGEPVENTLSALRYSSFLYDTLADLFIHRSLHTPATFVSKKAMKAYLQVHKLGLFSTMNDVNTRRFVSPKSIQLFNRYATYNGSDPYQTPATMNIIPHLEFGVGAFIPEKGMHQITGSLFDLAKDLGVAFYFDQKVERIPVSGNAVTGLQIAGEIHRHDYVISNMDMVGTYKKLLSGLPSPSRLLDQPKSSSALIFYWGIKAEFPALSLHNIFFSNDYQSEFEHIFSKRSICEDPTVYINVTSKYVAGDAPTGSENWFTMINVPNNTGQDWSVLKAYARKAVIEKLNRLLQADIGSLIEVEEVLDPISIESKTSSWQGALYGNSSNSKYAAFLRHPNKSARWKNLFFCGGSVHPGGGIPLCLSSAKIVAGYFPELH